MTDYSPLKKMLSEMLAKKNEEKALADATQQSKVYEERNQILDGIGKDMGGVMQPFIDKLSENSKMSAEELKRIIAEAVHVEVPSIDTSGIQQIIQEAFANFKIPEAKINVAAPVIPAPIVNIPAPTVNFPSEMSLKPNSKPFPVIMMDSGGKPMMFPQMSGGATGGRADFFTIKGFETSAFSELTNADGRLKVSVETGGSGLTDTELRASAVPVSQVSGANWSVYAQDALSTVTATTLVNADNRLRVSLETGGSGLTDAELRATPVPVQQVSGYADSVNVVTTVGLTDTQLRATAVPISAGATLIVDQLSGANWSTAVLSMPAVVVTSITNSVAASIVDSSGVQYSGSNPVPISGSVTATGGGYLTDAQLRAAHLDVQQTSGSVDSVIVNSGTITTVTTLTGITNTVAAANIDSSGVQYSGSNPFPITIVSGALTSTIVVGDLASGTADTGSAPVKMGGIARTTNPTAEADGDRITFTGDKLGRQVNRPIQVRDLISTAYVSVANGTETTLLAAGGAGVYLDCIMLTATNNSTVATQLDIRATTAGNIIHTMYLPASTGPVGWSLPVPWPQDNANNAWTIDMPDQTGTTVYVSALFSKEV